jgi:hypothetical protein
MHGEQLNESKEIRFTSSRITKFSIPGTTPEVLWRLEPPQSIMDLPQLSDGIRPEWTSSHTAFHTGRFRRASSYVRNYIPCCWPSQIKYLEQWIIPEWDCSPWGSRQGDEARSTNKLLHFALDLNLLYKRTM